MDIDITRDGRVRSIEICTSVTCTEGAFSIPADVWPQVEGQWQGMNQAGLGLCFIRFEFLKHVSLTPVEFSPRARKIRTNALQDAKRRSLRD